MSNEVCIEELQKISTTVNKLLEELQNGKTEARKELLIATRSLYLAVENPLEAILRMTWAEVRLIHWPDHRALFINSGS